MESKRHYHQFRIEEREVLSQLKALGATQKEMSRVLGFSERAIRAELRRNGCRGFYFACHAQQQADQRRCQARAKSAKLQRPQVREYVCDKLRCRWSPDQISGRMRLESPQDARRQVSAQTIYNWLKRDDHGWFWKRFLRGRPPKKRRVSADRRAGDIATRPDVINRRQRLGDWEGDTIVDPGSSASLVSLVERRSGYAELIAVEDRRADTVNAAIVRRLGKLPQPARLSLTFDNGSEFAHADELKPSLGLAIYFATPHSPWQRGSNEHFNRLVRDYLPKGTTFRGLDRRKLAEIQRSLNDRPRKRLHYQTPLEIFTQYCQRNLLT